MAEIEWGKIAIEAGISLASGIVGAVGWIWKRGRNSARAEQAVKDDYNAKISALRDEMRTTMATHALKVEDGNDLLVSQFKESFEGMRRQIDEHKFYTEKDFLKKEDFKEFRDEYREDMRDLKASIASISRQ